MANPVQSVNFHAYLQLKHRIENRLTVFIKDGSVFKEERLGDILGSGGSKIAISIGEGRALLVPNTDKDPIELVAERWPRMVKDEVKMSSCLSENWILNPESREVEIFLSKEMSSSIPAYLSISFEKLKELKIFIIDAKSYECSTWRKGIDYLFKTDEERLNPQNWLPLLAILVIDIATIAMYSFPCSIDQNNVAIHFYNQYHVRYFGFDYSSKHGSIETKFSKSNDDNTILRAQRLFEVIVSKVLNWEFCEPKGFLPKTDFLPLIESLVQIHNPLLAKAILIKP
jgi:hypothetical protein